MCSYIIQVLQSSPAITVCYFFCNSQDGGDLYHQLLKTIVLQLIRQHSEIVSSLIANQYASQACVTAKLKFLVPQLLQMFACSKIVVDGIDECSKESQKVVLKELQSICSEPNSRCKIIFSSRKEAGISVLLRQYLICLDERVEVNSDIEAFIRSSMADLVTHDPEVLKRVEAMLLSKANGAVRKTIPHNNR